MKVKRHYVATEVPRDIKDKLLKRAKAEQRTLAQFVRIQLIKLVGGNGSSGVRP